MAQCVSIDPVSGALTAVADPCTGYVVLSADEYVALRASPLNLSAEDGMALSVAIGAVWAAAWAFRALMAALNTDGEPSTSD